MQQRIAQLERKLKANQIITAILAVLLTGVAVLTQIPLRTPQSIYVGDRNGAHARLAPEGLFIVDANKSVRVGLDFGESGARIVLLDPKGAEGAGMHLTAAGSTLNLRSSIGPSINFVAEQNATSVMAAGDAKVQTVVRPGAASLSITGGKTSGNISLKGSSKGASVTAKLPSVPGTAALYVNAQVSGLAMGQATSPGLLQKDSKNGAAFLTVTSAGKTGMELRSNGLRRVVAPTAGNPGTEKVQ